VLHDIGLYELIVVLGCIAMYLMRRWRLPRGGNLLLLALHYAFWLWQFRGFLRGYRFQLEAFWNYALQERGWLHRSFGVLRVIVEYGWSGNLEVTALMPVVGLLSAFAWALYLSDRPVGRS
jgi:hypothetical protein